MIQPITDKAYKLLHEGTIALAEIEANGMRIDVDYLKSAIIQTKNKVKELQGNLKNHKEYEEWKKIYGSGMNLSSKLQLGHILFDIMKHENATFTNSDRYKTDEEALERLEIPFVNDYLEIEKLKKAEGTYLQGILRETNSDGFLHPFFDLFTTLSYRSSSSYPNFQNIPIRLPEISQLIRTAFIPRSPDRCIVEMDYDGIEIRGAAWYHKDPVMLSYIEDKSKDLHRDMAQQCFMLPPEELQNPVNDEDAKRIKNIRYSGKNKFVFPQFYGDYYVVCCKNLWNDIHVLKLHLRNGASLEKYLKKKCHIVGMGACIENQEPWPNTFEAHIKEVEKDFWTNRFKVYGQWRRDWYDAYQKKGYFDTLTGFRMSGIYRRNQVWNLPVQGVSSGHCVLWAVIEGTKALKKYNMKALLMGQIHDSIVGDVPEKEISNYLEIMNKIMTVDIKKYWEWIITSLKIEAEIAPAGKSWFEKKKYEI